MRCNPTKKDNCSEDYIQYKLFVVSTRSKIIAKMPSIEPTTEQHGSRSIVSGLNLLQNALNEYDVLEVSGVLSQRLWGDSDILDAYVLIKFLGSPEYFPSFKIYKVTSINHDDPTLSVSFINFTKFARQFNVSDFTINSCIVQSITKAEITALSKVYVSVPNGIYDVLSKNETSQIKELFLLKFIKESGCVINENDAIRLINATVNLCEPVSQGLVNEDTDIILIKEDDSLVSHSVKHKVEVEDVDISSYLLTGLNIEKSKKSTIDFQVKPIPEQITQLPELSKEDTEFFVYFTTDDLLKLNFSVYNGDIVKMNYGNSYVFVRVCTLAEPNKMFEPGCVYLSPILIINLNLNEKSRLSFETGGIDSLSSLSTILPVAESVTISRVASQITMDRTFQKSFFSGLKTTMNSKFKCVQKGDFFPVTIDTVLARTMFEEENGDDQGNESGNIIPVGDRDAVAWFKIVDVKGTPNGSGQFIIDPKETFLLSSGIEYVMMPENQFSQWYSYLELPPLFNFNQIISYSNDQELFKYATELKKIILTCLNASVALKTTVCLNSLNRGIGKTTLVRNMCTEFGLNLIELDCLDFINPGQELKTIGHLSGKIDNILKHQEDVTSSNFQVIFLKHIENLCPKVDENDSNSSIFASLSLKVSSLLNDYLSRYPNLIVVFSCNDPDKMSEQIKQLVKFNIHFNVPTEQERYQIFKFLTSQEMGDIHGESKESGLSALSKDSFRVDTANFLLRKDVNLKTLALQSAGLTPRDLISIIGKCKKLAVKRLAKVAAENNTTLGKIVKVGNGGFVIITPEDFSAAINEARNQFSDSIGAPRIPNVKWEDIGGLDMVKDEILDTIEMPLKHPELFNNGLKKRSGILFYGPPGTGKTLLAKAIATNFSLNFFSVKGPELLNMYIGESEANVRRVFQKARDAKPCVIFFDELDSVAPKRGNQGDSGGVMDRIVSQLLAELDGMSGGGGNSGDGVFVVGATNRPDLLDEALLRPGRFDKMLYLGISDTNEKQVKILEALTRKFKLHPDVNLEKIAEKCSFTFTGADFYALCSDSMLNAMTRVANEADAKLTAYNANRSSPVSTRWWFDNVATEEDINVLVKMEDFLKSQRELNPSVSAEELEHYLRVRENFEGGKEKAKT